MAQRLGSIVLLALAACAGEAPRADDAMKLYEAGEYERALAACGEAISRNPGDSDAYYRRACCRLHLMEQQGVKEEPARLAIDDLDRAIELAPDDYRAYYARAMAYAAQARFKEAAHDLLVCVQSQDKTLKRKAHRRLAEIYDEKLEELQAPALRHYEAYLQMGGNDLEAVMRCAELKKAEQERSGSADAEPSQVKSLEQARLWASSGRHAEAVELLSRILSAPALSKEPLQEAKDLYVRERLAVETERKADALFEAAASMIKDGKTDTARALLEELVKKYPTTEAARAKAPAALLELLKEKK